jgi:hypothetical protein
METGPYYFVKNLPLHELITQEFINTFVKKGKKNLVLSCNEQSKWGTTGRPQHCKRVPLVLKRACGDSGVVKWVLRSHLLSCIPSYSFLHPILLFPASSLGGSFLLHLSPSLGWRCCNVMSVIIKQGSTERKVCHLCSHVLILGMSLQRDCALSCPHSGCVRCSHSCWLLGQVLLSVQCLLRFCVSHLLDWQVCSVVSRSHCLKLYFRVSLGVPPSPPEPLYTGHGLASL